MKRGYGSLLLLCIPFLLCACGKTESAVPAGMTPVPTAAVSTPKPETQAPGAPDPAGAAAPTTAPDAKPMATPEEAEAKSNRERLSSLQTPYYCATSPLCCTWVGVGADESYAYEFTISDRGYFTLSYHDRAIADGLGEDSITWQTSGGIQLEEDRLILRVHNDGDPFTIEYACRLEPGSLVLTNLGAEQVFANLEWEAEAAHSDSISFRKYLPDIAYLATAFAICGSYDQQDASEQHFWEVLTTAISLYEFNCLPDGAPIPEELAYNADQLESFALSLFGRHYRQTLPDTAGTLVTEQRMGIYRFPFRKEVCAWSVDLLEHFWNGSMLLAITEAGEAPIYIRFPLDNFYDVYSLTYHFQIRDVLPVYLVESQAEYLNRFLGVHQYLDHDPSGMERIHTVVIRNRTEHEESGDGSEFDVEVQLRSSEIDEVLYCRAIFANGDLHINYIGGTSQGEPAALYGHDAGLFYLTLTPGGGVTLWPEEILMYRDGPLTEMPAP